MGKNSIKILNINKKLLSVYEGDGIITFFLGEKKGYLQLYRRFQFYLHTSGVCKNNIKLNPLFVSGFIDGEGCFYVFVTKNKKFKVG